jgi:membrane protease YdiL (CAAX protease family)
MSKKRDIIELIIAVLGAYAMLTALVMFNRHLLMGFPLSARIVLTVVTQWALFLVPGILMLVRREKIADLGFSKEKVPNQIAAGVIIAVAMSAVFTVLPILLGFKDMVGATSYTKAWQFIYQFGYAILGVALAEELIFRGYIFYKLIKIKDSKWFAIIVSSLLFGFFHIFNGNIIQIAMTTILGIIYCVLRERIKHCTTLSLIIAHGMYDALIVLWVAVL